MNYYKIPPIFFIFFLIMSFSVTAQQKGKPITIGESFSIQSEILGEERPYWIHLPQSYALNGAPLSVMYLLDGAAHFHHTTGITNFLARQGHIPNMIVVAIPNTSDRTRDLTPAIEKDEASKKQFPTGGEAHKMLDFIKKELIPHIEKNYHTNEYRVLVGHSFGGLFAVNTLMTEPKLFDGYISISPSMWWDQQNMVDKAEIFFDKHPDLEGFFYMTMGSEDGEMLGGAMKFAALMEEKAPDSFGWDFKVMKEEDHGSVPHRSTYYGLEAIFKDWFKVDYAQLYTDGGIKGIERHFKKLAKKFGYEMEVSESELNNLGYRFMRQEKLDQALEIFQLNIDRFPKSFNVYDSMGEAYFTKGNNESAIKMYKKSLERHPGSTSAIDMLTKMGVEYDPEKQMITLSAKKLKKFVGKYELSSGIVATMSVEDGKLIALAKDMPKLTLLPFSEKEFLVQPLNSPIEFIFNDKNEVTGIEIQTGIGSVDHGVKVENE